ncbi:MAG: hypothetical protein JWN50_521 [Parcubacteria group bacterium]|nr:hypothetical protein [Parcubacteria group bacterium]
MARKILYFPSRVPSPDPNGSEDYQNVERQLAAGFERLFDAFDRIDDKLEKGIGTTKQLLKGVAKKNRKGT